MVPPPITIMSKLQPDGGGVTFWRGSRLDAGFSAMTLSLLDVFGMDALEHGPLEISGEHGLRGAQRALHPALIERIGLAGDEDVVIVHRFEHELVGNVRLHVRRPRVIAGAVERIGPPVLVHGPGGDRLRYRHSVHLSELIERHVDHGGRGPPRPARPTPPPPA